MARGLAVLSLKSNAYLSWKGKERKSKMHRKSPKQNPVFARVMKTEIVTYGQFHQHFTHKVFAQMLFWQLFSSYMYEEKAAKMTFIWKICT